MADEKTREANPERHEDDLERSVVRVEGMDCASCATTIEKRVAALPGMRRAVVNFAAGRLDAEHDPGLSPEEIETAVRDAGYRVGRTEEAEGTPFWRTSRAISVFASAILFALVLALGFLGAPDAARVGAYATAIVVGAYRSSVPPLRACRRDAPRGQATLESLRSAGVKELVMLTGTRRPRPEGRRRPWASATGHSFSPSKRWRRCASWWPSTAWRAWSATA